MKALTLTQPWASLVAVGAKRIETRSWTTRHRGPLAIHAGKGLGGIGKGATETDLERLCAEEPFASALAGRELPRGAIVAVARLVDVVRINGNGTLPIDVVGRFVAAENEAAFGNYAAGRYAWLLDEVRPLAEPVECTGARLLWEVPHLLAAEVLDSVDLLDAWAETVNP